MIKASTRFNKELEFKVTVPMGNWIAINYPPVGGPEGERDAVVFQGKGDCEVKDLWFNAGPPGPGKIGADDGNNNYHDTDRQKNGGMCTFTTYRPYNTNDNKDHALTCDTTKPEDRIEDWMWYGSTTGGEFNSQPDKDRMKKFAVLFSNDCTYVFASAKYLAVATASMAAIASLYM